VGRRRTAHAHAFWSASTQARLARAVAAWKPDAVHVHRIRMMPYAERLGLPYLLDATDCMSWYFRHARTLRGWRRAYAAADIGPLARHERDWANGAAAVMAITAAERAKFLALGVRRPVLVAPNGLPPAAFTRSAVKRHGMLFVGNLGYPPNAAGLAWFFRDIAPRLPAAARRTRLTIAGGGATAGLRRLAARSGLPVAFPGFVADLRAHYAQAAAVLCPLPLAAGLQNKAVEALAAGAPVVATPNVAAAIGARPGRELLTAADAGGFAAAVDRLVTERGLRTRLGAAGRRFARSRFAAAPAARALDRAVVLLARAAR